MPVLIAVLLALLWVFALRRWYRQAPSPLESVEHQQRALDALQHAASRSRTGPTPAAGMARPVPGLPPRAGRAQRSLAPIAIALIGTLLLAGVGAVWWIGRNSNEKQSATSGTSPTSSTRRRAGPTTTTTTTVATTTTTSPLVAHATVTTQSANSVVFAVDKPTFTLAISATAPCWVRAQPATSGQNGGSGFGQSTSQTGTPTLFEGTLHAGDTQPIPVNGALLVRLGAANNVTLTLDGQPLPLPSQSGRTLDLTFNGSSNGA